MFIGTKDINTFVLITLHQCPAEITNPIITCRQWMVIKALLGYRYVNGP